MNGELYNYFFGDHRELEEALAQAAASATIEPVAYAKFRNGLLRHIALEEKVLLPALERVTKDRMKPVLDRIHADHGAIAALLVPPPTHGIVRAIRHILGLHNVLEESPEGLYDVCEHLPEDVVAEIVLKARSAPAVLVQPHNGGPGVIEATMRALQRAGYDPELMS